jgi:hypothetical protein
VPGGQVPTLSTRYIPPNTVSRASVTMKLAKTASMGKTSRTWALWWASKATRSMRHAS